MPGTKWPNCRNFPVQNYCDVKSVTSGVKNNILKPKMKRSIVGLLSIEVMGREHFFVFVFFLLCGVISATLESVIKCVNGGHRDCILYLFPIISIESCEFWGQQ